MKTALIFAAMLVALSSFPLISQQPGSSPQQASPQQSSPDSAQQANPPAGPTSSAPAASAAEMSPVDAELVGKLDSKTAKNGDTVVVKTETSVKTADGMVIPKGSKLTGHVTGVQAQGQGSQNSQVSIQFDRAEVNGGQSVPIQTVIKSVAPAGGETSPSGADTTGMPAGSAPGASAPAGGGPAGASPHSGSTGSAPEASGGQAASPAPSSADNASNAPAPGTVVARTGNIAIRTTSIPGVLIANNDNGQDPRMARSSGILLGAKRDVQLDGGTKMELAVAAAAGTH